jgi:hypothetical protein
MEKDVLKNSVFEVLLRQKLAITVLRSGGEDSWKRGIMKKYNYFLILFCICLTAIPQLNTYAQTTEKSDVIQRQIESFACNMNNMRTGISEKDNTIREEQEIYLLDLLNKKFQIEINTNDSLYVYFLNKSQEDQANSASWLLQANHFLKWKEIHQTEQQLWNDFYNRKKHILIEQTLNVMRIEQNDTTIQSFKGNSIDYQLEYKGRCLDTIIKYFDINCPYRKQKVKFCKRKKK